MESNVISMAERRARDEGPDPDCVRYDEYGRKLGRFSVSYDHEGSEFSFYIYCHTQAEAEAKVASIRASARYDGQVMSVIPV